MEARHQQLTGLLENIRTRTSVPGLAVALMRDGVLTTACVGTASLESGIPLSIAGRFQVGCITKMLTCLVTLHLIRDGRLDPEAPIGEYLQEVSSSPKGRQILIRHLASHSSGYQGINLASPECAYFYRWDKFLDFFSATAQLFVPGTTFNYEHTEIVILGEIIRRRTGLTAAQLTRELIFEPLGLAAEPDTIDSAIAHHARDAVSGQYRVVRDRPYCDFWAASLANLSLSASKLATLADALSRPTLASSPHLSLLASRQITYLPRYLGAKGCEQMPLSFGFGCAEYAGGLFGHNGSGRGQTCGLRFDPKRRLGIVVALNAWQPHVRDLLLNSLAEVPTEPAPIAAGPVPSWPLAELEGNYTGCVQGVQLTIKRVPTGIECHIHNRVAKSSACMALSHDENGQLVMNTAAQHIPIAFFYERGTGTPCAMVGLNAFKRSD